MSSQTPTVDIDGAEKIWTSSAAGETGSKASSGQDKVPPASSSVDSIWDGLDLLPELSDVLTDTAETYCGTVNVQHVDVDNEQQINAQPTPCSLSWADEMIEENARITNSIDVMSSAFLQDAMTVGSHPQVIDFPSESPSPSDGYHHISGDSVPRPALSSATSSDFDMFNDKLPEFLPVSDLEEDEMDWLQSMVMDGPGLTPMTPTIGYRGCYQAQSSASNDLVAHEHLLNDNVCNREGQGLSQHRFNQPSNVDDRNESCRNQKSILQGNSGGTSYVSDRSVLLSNGSNHWYSAHSCPDDRHDAGYLDSSLGSCNMPISTMLVDPVLGQLGRELNQIRDAHLAVAS